MKCPDCGRGRIREWKYDTVTMMLRVEHDNGVVCTIGPVHPNGDLVFPPEEKK